MKKIIFVANNNIGKGFSGGDRIFVELLKNYKGIFDIILMGSQEAVESSFERGASGFKVIQTDERNTAKNFFTYNGMIVRVFRRTVKGIIAVINNFEYFKKADFVYSVSDFYPDFAPAFILKLMNRKLKWIAGYYLFAPSPLSAQSPYKGRNKLKGLLYWLMQKPSYFFIKKFADFIFVTSEPDVKRFITKKRDKSKIIVVQGGVDIDASEKYLNCGNIVPFEQRKYDVCFVGRFHVQKGVLDLIDIWKKVTAVQPNRKLALIGDGELEHEIKEKIIKDGLEDTINLLGFMDGVDKYEIFKQSKIIVHPATYDSGGMAAAEGMAWGLPGVSFDLEALKTYYPKGMIKTKIGDNDEFARNIVKLLDDENLYKKTAKDAHDLIVGVWDWKKRAEIILKAIY